MDIPSIRLLSAGAPVSVSSVSAGGSAFAEVLQQTGVQSPANMDEIFARASQETGVPVNLLKAVAKAESDFDPNVVSHAGAMGVMQLMPENCQTLGVTDPFDAEQNILGGAKHLRHMLDRYDGDITLGLAAYNAGPGNVNKYGGIPPFKETQNYVRRVMKYAGEDLGIIGAVPARAAGLSGSGAQPAQASLQTGALLSQLISSILPESDGVTSADEAAQLYDALHTLIEAKLSNALNQAEDDSTFQDAFLSPAQQQRIHYLSF